MDQDPLATADRSSALLGLAVAGAFAWASGERAAVAALVGAILAFANLRVIRTLSSRAVASLGSEAPGGVAAGLAAVLSFKMTALFVLFWAAVNLAHLPVLPLGLGFFVLVPALLLAALRFSRLRTAEALDGVSSPATPGV